MRYVLPLIFLFATAAEAQQVQPSGTVPCAKECSDHLAGYGWAMRKQFTAPQQCASKSKAYTAGCLEYIEKQQSK